MALFLSTSKEFPEVDCMTFSLSSQYEPLLVKLMFFSVSIYNPMSSQISAPSLGHIGRLH